MANEYNPDGSIKSSAGLQGLLAGVLGDAIGKQSETDTNSTQNTNNTTSTLGTTSTSGSGTQATTQTGGSTQNTTGTQTGSNTQTTGGTTVNTGSQATTGNVNTNNTTTQNTQSVQTGTADIAGLQQVFAQQKAGITPEMLAAIFSEGAKAAPQLVTAQSNALGARAVGNSPVAQSLNMLNSSLVSKAADLNRQMLSDAGSTAGKIADSTKSVTTANTGSTTSLQSQIQDLLTRNDSRAVVDQIVSAINSQQTAQQQVGTSNQQQNTASTQQQNSTQQQTGTQQQQVTATEDKKTATTINVSAARDLLGMAAAGVGVNELFRLATGKGFSGTVQQFVNYLKGLGATNITGDVTIPTDVNIPDYQLGDGVIPDYTEDGGTPLPEFEVDGYAEGGVVSFLPSKQLIKPTTDKNEDADVNSLMAALMGGSRGVSSGGGSSSGSSGASNSPSGSTDFTEQGGTAGAADGPATNAADSVNPAAIGVIGAIASALGVPGVATAINGLTAISNALGLAPPGLSPAQLAQQQVDNAIDSDANVASITADADAAATVAPGLDTSIDAPSLGSAGDDGSSGNTSEGDANGNGDYAEGGVVTAEDSDDNDEMLSLFGITRGTQKGSMVFDERAVKLIHRAIAGPSQKPPGYKNGAIIKGPGTGTSDSIPAVGPGGRPLRVSNGEAIIPAHIVQQYGADTFERFIEAHNNGQR